MKKLIQLKSKEVKELRDKILQEQNGICPLCKMLIKEGEEALDHQHKTKAENIGESGAGLIRGVLCRNCNVAEGRILHQYKRAGVYLKNFPDFLRNLADYLEEDNQHFVHPSEAPKAPRLGKNAFKQLQKLYKEKYPRRKKGLQYPKNGKVTITWERLFEEFGIENSIKEKK